MIVLSKEQILLMHGQLIECYGGIHEVRDDGLLDSAIHAPFQSFDGREFFPTVIDKATRLCTGLIQNHPFCDGNKRIAAMALLTTLDLNHIALHANSHELADIILQLAANKVDNELFLHWIKERTHFT